MAKFDVKVDGLKKSISAVDAQAEDLGNDISRLLRVKSMIKGDEALEICRQAVTREITSARKVQKKVLVYGATLDQIIKKYEVCEDNIVNNINSHMLFSATGGAGSSGSSQADSDESSQQYKDYSDWGTKPGLISPVEYALLSQFCNEASTMGSEKEMAESFARNLESLPDGHPLKGAKFYTYRGGTYDSLDAFIIEIDPDHAIVVFGGTTQLDDMTTDAGIAADSTPILNGVSGVNHAVNPAEWFTESQFEAANKLINDVSKQYKDIKVTGHSLGGHLAVDVTLNNESVSECVVFDPPGRGDAFWREAIDPGNRVSKITNYTCKGSNVSAVGEQVGHTVELDVESSYIPVIGDVAGLNNHKIENIVSFFGGKESIAPGSENTGGPEYCGSFGSVASGGGGGGSW